MRKCCVSILILLFTISIEAALTDVPTYSSYEQVKQPRSISATRNNDPVCLSALDLSKNVANANGVPGLSDRTISLWCYMSNLYRTYDIFLFQYGSFSISLDPHNFVQIVARTESGNYIYTGLEIVTDAWNHVLVAYDLQNRTVTLNLNSQLKIMPVPAKPTVLNYGNLIFGSVTPALTSGYLTQIKLWSYVLSQTEIDMEMSADGYLGSITSYWDGSYAPNVFYDYWGNNHANVTGDVANVCKPNYVEVGTGLRTVSTTSYMDTTSTTGTSTTGQYSTSSTTSTTSSSSTGIVGVELVGNLYLTINDKDKIYISIPYEERGVYITIVELPLIAPQQYSFNISFSWNYRTPTAIPMTIYLVNFFPNEYGLYFYRNFTWVHAYTTCSEAPNPNNDHLTVNICEEGHYVVLPTPKFQYQQAVRESSNASTIIAVVASTGLVVIVGIIAAIIVIRRRKLNNAANELEMPSADNVRVEREENDRGNFLVEMRVDDQVANVSQDEPSANLSENQSREEQVVNMRDNEVKEENRLATLKSEYTDKQIEEDISTSNDDETNICKVCFVNKITMVIVDCGHAMLCEDCSKMLKECPMCRVKITKCIKFYLS